jgi:hypothetical protein
VVAAPELAKSEIQVSSEAPLEADVVTFTFVLRNTGTDPAGAVSLTVEWPLMGFLVDATGFEAPRFDHEAREISDTFAMPVGAERRITVRVLAPRDSGGDTLTTAFKAVHYASQTEYRDSRSVSIDTRPAPGGIVVGGYRVLPTGLAVIAWVTAFAILLLLVRGWSGRRRSGSSSRRSRDSSSLGAAVARHVGPAGAVAAIMIALGFWLMFGAMAWRDYRSVTSWPRTECTILGGRLSAQTTTRSSTAPRRDTTNYVPVLGLRYEANGLETLSSGYDTGSRLGFGGQGGRTEELGRWSVGSRVPCWFNPDDPLDVVVVNGFGGAYLFALLPLPVFLLGLASLRRQ